MRGLYIYRRRHTKFWIVTRHGATATLFEYGNSGVTIVLASRTLHLNLSAILFLHPVSSAVVLQSSWLFLASLAQATFSPLNQRDRPFTRRRLPLGDSQTDVHDPTCFLSFVPPFWRCSWFHMQVACLGKAQLQEGHEDTPKIWLAMHISPRTEGSARVRRSTERAAILSVQGKRTGESDLTFHVYLAQPLSSWSIP